MRCLMSRASWFVFTFLLFACHNSALAAGQASDLVPDRSITHVTGGLYRVRDGAQTTVFLATADGIVLVDPLNPAFARWLKAELEKMFPNQRVKFVVYTGLDFDRISGVGLFYPAVIIAQNRLRDRFAEMRRVLPQRLAVYDRNGNGTLEGNEIQAAGRADLSRLDRNMDAHLTGEELWSETSNAGESYRDRYRLTLGGEQIELVYPGPMAGAGSTAIYFRNERVAFVGEHPSVTAPFSDPSVRPIDLAIWTTTLAAWDFDTLLSGDGAAISHDDLAALDNYVNSLVSVVAARRESGRSVQQIQRDSAVQRLSGSPYATLRDADIESVYQRSATLVVDAYGAALGNYISVNNFPCGSAPVCDYSGTTGAGGMAGFAGSLRKFRVALEVSRGSQLTLNIAHPLYSTRVNSRETHLALLGGYRTAPSGVFNITMMAGVSLVTVEGTAVYSWRPGETYTNDDGGAGLTLGADIAFPFGSRFGLIAPIRLTTPTSDLKRSGVDLRAGVGVRLVAIRAPM